MIKKKIQKEKGKLKAVACGQLPGVKVTEGDGNRHEGGRHRLRRARFA